MKIHIPKQTNKKIVKTDTVLPFFSSLMFGLIEVTEFLYLLLSVYSNMLFWLKFIRKILFYTDTQSEDRRFESCFISMVDTLL